MIRRSLRSLGKYYIPTPFDHQPVAVPAVRSYTALVAAIAPPGELARTDEVQLLLKGLPAACDDAKEAMLQGKRASRYYRSRYGRGAELQRRQAEGVLAAGSEAEAQAWARGRCIKVNDPLVS